MLPAGVPLFRVCKKCLRHLRHGKVPSSALLNFDPGQRPIGLPALGFMEAKVLAVIRAQAYMACVHPIDVEQGAPFIPGNLRGHVICVPASTPGRIARLFPCPLSDVPDLITVVLLGPISSRKQAQELCKKIPFMQVRVRVPVLTKAMRCKDSPI